MAKSKTPDYVPTSYNDMYDVYFYYVTQIVSMYGIESQSCEDVANDILIRFINHDALKDYDPTRLHERNGRQYKATFRSFLTGFVKAYLRRSREQQSLRWGREPLICDTPAGDDGSTWVEAFDLLARDEISEALERVHEQEIVAYWRSHLAQVPRNTKSDICDLVALFDSVVRQVRVRGEIKVVDLATELGVTKTTINKWLKRMRTNLEVVR